MCFFVLLRLLFIRCLKSASKERRHAAGIVCLPTGKIKSQVASERQLSEMVTSAQLRFPIYLSISVLKRTGRWPAAELKLNKGTGKVLDSPGSAPVGCGSSTTLAWRVVFPSLEEQGRESMKCFRCLSGVFLLLPQAGGSPGTAWNVTHPRALQATCLFTLIGSEGRAGGCES